MFFQTRLDIFFIIFCLVLVTGKARSTDVYDLDKTVVVTADRLSSPFSEIARSVIVLTRQQIDESPGQSLEDVLANTAGIDIRQRGYGGAQADISVRGGNFQQVLILVDGTRMNNPQTGHHNLNLPVSLDEVERIEILKGPASRLFGPDAMHGIVNIITRRSTKNRLMVSARAGDFGFFDRQAALSFTHGLIGHSLSFGRSSSTGFRDNTEFDINTFAYRGNFSTAKNQVDFSAGYSQKEYGAHKYYSDIYPDEWEAVESLLLSIGYGYAGQNLTVSPKIGWRRHDDDFILDRNRPDWYRNRHTTDQYGFQLQMDLETPLGISVFGFEWANELMTSSSLGNHQLSRRGIFFEQRLTPVFRLIIIPGFSVYHHSIIDWKIWPGLDINYQVSKSGKVYFSFGKSYRVPTFTELYYQSPANIGDPHLEVETAQSFEIGAGFVTPPIVANVSVFLHKDQNVIEWIRAVESDPWRARNIGRLNSRGMEMELSVNIASIMKTLILTGIRIQYSHLDLDYSLSGFESKYEGDNLKHKLIVDLDQDWLSIAGQKWILRYLKKLDDQDYVIVDTKISRQLGKIRLFAEITNLFNISYSEVGTIPMPGRWFRAGLIFGIYDQD